MNHKIAALVLTGLVFAAGACSKNEDTTPTASAPSTKSEAERKAELDKNLPTGGTVVRVAVTKPATVTSIDPNTLPLRARAVSMIPGITDAEKNCINQVIKSELDKDATLADNNPKLAGLQGEAASVCAGEERMAEILSSTLGSYQNQGAAALDTEQLACFKKALAETAHGAADLFASILTTNESVIKQQVKPYESKCGFSLSAS